MSSLIQGARIYEGAWIDWSKGPILGSTVTLSARKGAVVTAFLAFFVTVVGACLWRIICYIFHQFSASPAPQDGIHHQHQLILRNTSSPSEATRAFIENAFFWRKNGRKAFSRSFPLAAFALTFMLAFGMASILTALVTKAAGSARLIVSNNCGFWALDDSGKTSLTAMNTKDLADTVTAASYARTCYGGIADTNSLQCNMYTKKALPYLINEEVSYPFGDDICNATAYQLDTRRLNSHDEFGINTPHRGRLEFRKVTTCAPLKQQGYVNVTTSDGSIGAEGDRIRQYQYGSWSLASSMLDQTTWVMNQHAFVDNWGYQFEAIEHQANTTDAWIPIPALNRLDADTTIMFLAPNAIQYEEPNNDPFFHANFKVDLDILGESYYYSDNWANVMACADQYQFCNPLLSSGSCTPLSDYYQTMENLPSLSLNAVQDLTATLLILNLRTASIYHSINNRGAAALRAQETVNLRAQAPIPNNQWHIEVQSWFATALAKLQRATTSYAAGPEHVTTGSHIEPPNGPASRALCYSQKVQLTSNTVSFSVLGMSLTLVTGLFVIFTYLILESIVSLLQKRYQWGDHRRLRWIMDDKMQIQRMAFEEAGMGTWSNLTNSVPVTAKGETFGGLGHVDPSEPRLGEKWTGSTNTRSTTADEGAAWSEDLCDSDGDRSGRMTPMPPYPDTAMSSDMKPGVIVYQKPVYQPLTPPST